MIVFFVLVSLTLLASGVGVIAFKNPVHSALSLVVNLLGIAVLFAMLDSHFLATAQILVYAGAIMVLLLFVIMLLNVKIERTRESRLAYILLGASALAYIGAVLFAQLNIQFGKNAFFKKDYLGIGDFASSQLDASATGIGDILFSKYIFAFEFASCLIIVAVVGAIVLAQRKSSSVSPGIAPRETFIRANSENANSGVPL